MDEKLGKQKEKSVQWKTVKIKKEFTLLVRKEKFFLHEIVTDIEVECKLATLKKIFWDYSTLFYNLPNYMWAMPIKNKQGITITGASRDVLRKSKTKTREDMVMRGEEFDKKNLGISDK